MAVVDDAMVIAVPLVQHYEGCSLSVYQNRGDVPTIGWGNTQYQDGTAVTMDDMDISQQDADELFAFWLSDFMKQVSPHVPAALPCELAAFTSLAYNIGVHGFTISSALRHYLHGDKTGAGSAIELWNQSGGRVVKGLERRRRAEHLVFDGTPVVIAVGQAERDYP